jgi:redox-sensitive bicupin YhaK (pirin superfamily)
MMTIVGISGCGDGFLLHAGPVLHKPAARYNRFAMNACVEIEQTFGDFQSVRMDKINPNGSGLWK